MTFQRSIRVVVAVAVVGLAQCAVAASARAADVPTHTIAPSLTDPAITDPPAPSPSRGDNLVWLAPDPSRRVGKLLVFLPTGGATNLPSEFTELGTVASHLGYHTIILAYRNEAPIAALPTANPPGCGNAETVPATNTCARDARREILDGNNESPVVNVDQANGIENRLNKLLVYLKNTYPDEGWAQFLDDSGVAPNWSQTVIAGSSLGAGEAAMIAQRHDVYRVALLHGWVDARYDWVKDPSATPYADYFSLIHARDNFFPRTCYAYLAYGFVSACPYTDFPLPIAADNPKLIENRTPPFTGLQMHVFNLEPGATDGGGDIYHQSTSRNHWIAKEADGITPSHILVSAWSSVLGDETDGDGITNTNDNCPATANPGQADADGDAVGDACDATPRGTIPPVITVAPITADATGPTGALVAYTATATDDLDGARPVTCSPAAGQFAIGTTSVACSATDAGGNTANASFAVTVRGAPEQLGRLVTKVGGSPALAALFAGLDPNRPLQRLVACVALRAFIVLVPYVAPANAAGWIADANRIRAVLAC